MITTIDVSSISLAQDFLFQQVFLNFGKLTIYAKHLLYFFITFELVLSGFAWALYQNQHIEKLVFQILKIGLIIFFIEHYTYILNSLLSSVSLIGSHFNEADAQKVLLNPSLIWEYGYNYALSLMQAAANAEGFALPLILTILGFGILLLVGLFGIQTMLQVFGFYCIAFISLLSMPLATFSPLKSFFSKSIQLILQAAIRLMIQILLVSTSLSIWAPMKLHTFNISNGINEPLGFLFSALLLVLASAYIPKLATKVISNIEFQTLNNSTNLVATNSVIQTHHALSSSNQTQQTQSVSALTQCINSMTQQLQYQTHMEPIKVTPSETATSQQLFYQQQLTLLKEKAAGLQPQEDIKKIKQAFYEVLDEIQSRNKKDNHHDHAS